MVGDSLSYHNGMQFSTKDTDNDKNSDNCAASYHGRWCYHSCHASSLNGEYLNNPRTSPSDGVYWCNFEGCNYLFRETEIKVRPAICLYFFAVFLNCFSTMES